MTLEFLKADCLEWMRGQPDGRFDLVFGSPPYVDARLYLEDGQDLGVSRDCRQWVEWMLQVTREAHRISRGPVIWVAAGVTRDRNYWPACEGLAWEWHRLGGDHTMYRPCVFHRVGIPGSGGDDWFRADWEFILCFKHDGPLPWSDNTACGHPPKYAPGGEMSYRLADGSRRNKWGRDCSTGNRDANGERKPQSDVEGANNYGRDEFGFAGPDVSRRANGKRRTSKGDGERFAHAEHGSVKGSHARDIPRAKKQQTRRKPNGERPGADGNEQDYQEPVLANPGNVLHIPVGGGLMGDSRCHENEAPFPEKLAEFFVLSCCPPGGLVLDPFAGSFTTCAVAKRFGRNAVGVDLRQSQVDLGKRRCSEVQLSLLT